MKITANYLLAHGACESEVREFEELFPNGAELNLENLLKAAEKHLSMFWIGLNLLPDKQLFIDWACKAREVWWKRSDEYQLLELHWDGVFCDAVGPHQEKLRREAADNIKKYRELSDLMIGQIDVGYAKIFWFLYKRYGLRYPEEIK